ncbi:MAG: protein kinase [Gemmatimonadetes bacterium]|nr:protein kinase [Gemmatimonadota bacterium]
MTSGDAGGRAFPRVSDRYRMVRELGHGGMATVYLAADVRYEREVAIKVLSPEISQGMAAERFLREVSVAAKLTHPHIVPLLDSGETDGVLWFAMPVLEGQSLRARLDREPQLPLAEAVRIAREVASALSYAHAHDVVHRDIKPENVLLSGGVATVADFGLAKGIAASGSDALTLTGMSVGTPYYMSPEQATGSEAVDGRSDIYSLGCMLYEMLTGEPPYVGKTAQAIIAKSLTDPIPSARRLRGAIPAAVDDVIAKALARNAVDRYATGDEFIEALTLAAGSDARLDRAPARGSRWTSRRVAAAVVGTLLVAAGAVALARRPATAVLAAAHRPRSIAVLPFVNASGDKAQEYFSSGMTDELIGALSKVKRLRVAARASSYALRDHASTPIYIGRKLNVEAVLEGTVDRSGDRVRVTAELVNAEDGYVVWNDTYERRVSDVFALQQQITTAIVEAVKLEVGDAAAVVQRPTEDLQAYEMYLKGRHAWDTRTAESLEEATSWFGKAVERDPRYARAWSGLADVYIVQALNLYAAPDVAMPKGKAAALRALALDSTLAEAHTSLGTVRFLYDRDYAGAQASYDRAIALDSTYPPAHYFYALYLATRDSARAEREALLAETLDPLSPPLAQGTGIVRVSDGNFAAAVAPLRAAVALAPKYYFAHAWLGLALARAGGGAEAVAEARRAVALNPANTLVLGFLGEVYALTGDRAAALTVVAKLDSLSATRTISNLHVARILDRLGDTERAFVFLDRAMAAHEGQLTQLNWPGTFTHARGDPRFQRLVKAVGLE